MENKDNFWELYITQNVYILIKLVKPKIINVSVSVSVSVSVNTNEK